jgi:hypothetical protein
MGISVTLLSFLIPKMKELMDVSAEDAEGFFARTYPEVELNKDS